MFFFYPPIFINNVLVTTQPEIDKLLIDEFFVWGACQPTNQRPAVTKAPCGCIYSYIN